MALAVKRPKNRMPSSRFVFHDLDIYELFRKAKERARERSIHFGLSREDVAALLLRANGRCEVSRIPFNKDYRPDGCTKRPWFPSIDRIDSQGSYTVGNCLVVCVAVNIALGEWGIDVLRQISRSITLGNN